VVTAWRRLALVALVLMAAFGWIGISQAAPAVEAVGFGVDDYFRLTRITELALSPDGGQIAYVAQASDGTDRREVLLQPTAGQGQAIARAELAGARNLAWVRATGELAFLADASGRSQVFCWDPRTGRRRQRTEALNPVTDFAFSPDGVSLAYVSAAPPAAGESLYERFRSGERGILIDFDTLSLHDFLNPDWNALVRPAPGRLWIQPAAGSAVEVRASEAASFTGVFHWSPDGRRLSAVFIAAAAAGGILSDDQTSLGVIDVASGRLTVLAQARAARGAAPAVSYAGGEWAPSGKLVVRRVVDTDPWTSGSFPDWAIVDASPSGVGAAAWRSAELYPRGLRLLPVSDRRIEVETTLAGVRGLYALTPQGLTRNAPLGGLGGSSSLVSFTPDRRRVAFVNEALDRPPEVFLAGRDGMSPRRLTTLNAAIASRVRFTARQVRWTSRDGSLLAGWLLEPPGPHTAPVPLVVHVHGGPAFPHQDAFAAYFEMWPQPLEVLAENGFAVFLPNYRGTHTYGRRIAAGGTPEAIDDIETGVESLVAAGVADPQRLAITGHSHGAYLGPQVLAHARRFKAAAFAEGVANSVVMYELVGDEANREIHDRIFGASLYADPARYLADSPDLQFAGVSTATLFEGGARTGALVMLGFPKAARRAGMPTEFVVYPKTGHNLAIPALQAESARRNLAWFEFWLRGRELPAAVEAEEYVRWRTLREGPAR
jgi:dipeptidyl aminopeptidase/acylaminoacyl peptidase